MSSETQEPPYLIELGSTAPDFTLNGAQEDEIREFTLSEFAAGRPVALVFLHL